MSVAEAPRLIPDHTISLGPVFHLALDALPDDSELIGPPPDRTLVNSLLLLGQLDPIAVSKDVRGQWTVHNGRRRVKACRILATQAEDDEAQLRWLTIEAREIDQLSSPGSVALAAAEIASNGNRSENPLSDLLALRTLFERCGVDPGNPTMDAISAVSKLTGMSYPKIKKRLKLLRLPATLFDAACEGRLRTGLAEQLAKLDRDTQERLAVLMEEGETLTIERIYEHTRAIRNDAQSELALALPVSAGATHDPGLEQLAEWLVERSGAAIRAAGLVQSADDCFIGPNGKRYRFSIAVEEIL